MWRNTCWKLTKWLWNVRTRQVLHRPTITTVLLQLCVVRKKNHRFYHWWKHLNDCNICFKTVLGVLTTEAMHESVTAGFAPHSALGWPGLSFSNEISSNKWLIFVALSELSDFVMAQKIPLSGNRALLLNGSSEGTFLIIVIWKSFNISATKSAIRSS